MKRLVAGLMAGLTFAFAANASAPGATVEQTMGWFNKAFKNTNGLIGRWVVDPSDQVAVGIYGDVTLEFDDSGNLTYTIKSPANAQIILMTYKVAGDEIITDQPSHPNPQRSHFTLEDDTLTISFEGQPSRFVRVPAS